MGISENASARSKPEWRLAFVIALFGGFIAGSTFAYHFLHITSSRIAVVGYATALLSIVALGIAAKIAEKTLVVSPGGVEVRSRSGVIDRIPLANVERVEWQSERKREWVATLCIAHTKGALRFRAKGREAGCLETCFRTLTAAIPAKADPNSTGATA